MMRQRQFNSIEEVAMVMESLVAAADSSLERVRSLAASRGAIEFLQAVNFQRIGRDPLNAERELNLIEQVNQTFTLLVTVRALQYLFQHHPGAAPFQINPATAAGSDIHSVDGTIAAECFAATHPRSNQKLKKDLAKVRDTDAKHRYVFFHCPGEHERQELDGVKVVPLGLGDLNGT